MEASPESSGLAGAAEVATAAEGAAALGGGVVNADRPRAAPSAHKIVASPMTANLTIVAPSRLFSGAVRDRWREAKGKAVCNA
jgi:hypothetical protein